MQIFRDIIDSMHKPKAYESFLTYNTARKTSYILLLPLFRVLLIMIVGVTAFIGRYGNISDYLKEYIPDFNLSSSGLDMEQKTDELYGNVYVYINTDETMDEKELYFRGANNLFVFKDAILIRDSLNQDTVLNFKEYNIPDGKVLTRDEFIDGIKPTLGGILAVLIIAGVLLSYVFFAVGYAFTALLLSVFIRIMALMMGMVLKDKQTFAISVYAKTATFVLTTVIILINLVLRPYFNYVIDIPYFYLIKMLVCIMYGYYTVLNIKTQNNRVSSPKPDYDKDIKYGDDIYKDRTKDPFKDEGYKDPFKESGYKDPYVQPERLEPTDSWSFSEKKDDGNE